MVANALRDRLDHWGDAPAVRWRGEVIAGREIAATAAQAIDCLNRLDPAGDEAVGLVIRNRPAHVAALFGLLAERRPVRFVNPFQASEKIARDLDELRLRVVLADREEWQAQPLTAWAGGAGRSAIELKGRQATLLHNGGSGGGEVAMLPGTAVEIFTSGTTGAPRRVRFSHETLEQAIQDQALIAAGMGEAPASPEPQAALIQFALREGLV